MDLPEVNKFKGSHPDSIEKVRRDFPLPKQYRKLLAIAGEDGFLAGGSVRFLVTKGADKAQSDDFDFYAYSPEGREKLLQNFLNAGFVIKHENVNAWSLKKKDIKVQIIKSFCGEIEKVVDEFDMTVCRIATDGKWVYRDKDFIEHNQKKLIVIKTIQCPIGALRRLIKYSKKGFHCSNFQFVKLYEHYISLGEDYRMKLLNLMNHNEENGKLEQHEFEELEAILIKVD